ncbi:putative MATE family efflux protein [Agromyces flavus]|uniref:MATE family efflux protein n=1 Tax=Agromyces flavus TaxID=589382 RepID=A0A1H1YLB3_9MICO|nr:MATE family efflux transporter [Agromyces flavus]MCP2366730.1 putative MATE family efflux protein [Agromyces flavus]GGI45257.1 MATE family efflux transporter [Agromyces flavus]SDT22222.1 putative efflux protein, MATE family [Agromyces flavus]
MSDPATIDVAARREVDRDILRLAVPALGALVAEPLFLLADTAMIGHLGAAPLAGLGLASAVLQTIIGLMIFLAYATTPSVARRLGAGDERGAVASGVDGLWLALGLGAVLGVVGWLASPWLVSAFGASAEVTAQATTYLAISMAGLPAMLVVFAATGLLRGLQDTRTPLWVAGVGFTANIALNALFIYGLGWGIAGSAIGTVVAQWGMVLVYLVVIARHVARVGASPWPHHAGVLRGAKSGGWLFLRTLSLRVALLLATWAAASLGRDELAAYQVAITIYFTLGFALDALAIAAQALIGKGLGAGDVAQVRAVLRRCVEWGIGSGAVIGALVIATAWVLPAVFTSSADVAALLPPSLVVLGLSAPLGGFVFVLDGVLIGAGDARYLAWTGLVNLAVFVPLAFGVVWWADASGPAVPGAAALAALTAAFAIGYLAARAVTLGLRARGRAWIVTGAPA